MVVSSFSNETDLKMYTSWKRYAYYANSIMEIQ